MQPGEVHAVPRLLKLKLPLESVVVVAKTVLGFELVLKAVTVAPANGVPLNETVPDAVFVGGGTAGFVFPPELPPPPPPHALSRPRATIESSNLNLFTAISP